MPGSISSRIHLLRFSLEQAVHDLRHDSRLSLVLIVSVASILAPLLLLFGLKTGVVSTLKQQLLEDPRNLEIIVFENARLDDAWFASLGKTGKVGFMVPRTRTINATMDVVGERRKVISGIEVIPTGTSDPLIPEGYRVPRELDQVILSYTAARRLGVAAGEKLQGVVKRRLQDRGQLVKFDLGIIEVLPESAYGRNALFSSVALLLAIEDYRDGFAVEEIGATEGARRQQQRTVFANARIYAKDLDAVSEVADFIRDSGVEVRTRARDIENVKAVERVLTFIFSVIAIIASIGFALSLIGALWINVERKRHDLALLRLLGLRREGVVLIPVIQAAGISIVAYLLAMLAYMIGENVFNQQLGANLSESQFVCKLLWTDAVIAGGLTLLVALLASLVGGYRASKVDPAECLREI